MSYCKGKKSVPVNLGLYNRIKSDVKRKVKRWPSAYASGQLVRIYKQKGGKYRCSSFGSLDRWFKEKWIDVCKRSSSGKNLPCGRKKSSPNGYPYCRPSRRISSQTPKTSFEIPNSILKKRCALKHRIKGKRLSFGKFKNFKNFKNFTLNLTSTKSINDLRKIILSTQPDDCLSWDDCKSWLYFISKKINDTRNIQFSLKREKYTIDKKPSNKFNSYIKNSKGNVVSFYSPGGTLLVIPRKGYINLMDFTFNASKKEWVDLWKRVLLESKKMKKPFYISTHGHSVNWLHIRLEKNIKFK